MDRTPLPDFRNLFEAAPGLFIVLRPDFSILAVSNDYLAVAKSGRDQIINRQFIEVFPDNPASPGGMGAIQESFKKVLRTGQSDVMAPRKYDIARPESEGGGFITKYWHSINAPILGPDGEVKYIVRRVEDVTIHIQAQGERKVIEEERDMFFAYSHDLLGIVGADGYFKRVSPSFEKAVGYTETELLAKPVVEFLHPDDVALTRKRMAGLAAGTRTISSMNRYLCKDRSYRWFSWNTIPVGELFYTIGRDITDEVAREEKIRQLNIELEIRNENLEAKIQDRVKELQHSEAQVQQLQKMDAVGRLAGGIAHDFNNILSAVTIYCDQMDEDAQDPELIRKKIGELRNVTGRAAALTKQLLLFSRKQVLQLQVVALNPLIERMDAMLARLIGENIKITTKLANDLKPIDADPSQMEQVVLNLVVNAKDAMPKGGSISIETSNVYLDENFTSTHLSVTPGHYVLLAVSDTGSGMDEATLKKIFEPFFTTKAVGKGTGLGLTTIYGIVKQAKGTVWVYSEIGQGTVFKIYLPISEKALVEAPSLAPQKVALERGHQTILVVEDDELLRLGFSQMLQRSGFQVLTAETGSEALDVCSRHPGKIHLLLTDMVMPGLSGLELALKARELRSDLRVLYMSGYTSDVLEQGGTDSLADHEFIQKPFSTSALVKKVQEILSLELKNM